MRARGASRPRWLRRWPSPPWPPAMTAVMIWLEGGAVMAGLVWYQGSSTTSWPMRCAPATCFHAALVLGTLSLFYGVAHAVGPGTARLSLIPLARRRGHDPERNRIGVSPPR